MNIPCQPSTKVNSKMSFWLIWTSWRRYFTSDWCFLETKTRRWYWEREMVSYFNFVIYGPWKKPRHCFEFAPIVPPNDWDTFCQNIVCYFSNTTFFYFTDLVDYLQMYSGIWWSTVVQFIKTYYFTVHIVHSKINYVKVHHIWSPNVFDVLIQFVLNLQKDRGSQRVSDQGPSEGLGSKPGLHAALSLIARKSHWRLRIGCDETGQKQFFNTTFFYWIENYFFNIIECSPVV